MPTYYDNNGNSYVLTHEIGRGGEGTVFYCPNDLSLVAKIYHEPIDEEKAEKLQWMAVNRNDGLLKVAAWIVDTLHDKPNGKIVGFVMPNVKAKEIHELYSLKSRRVHFPEATWKFLLHTAANVARAFYVLHKNDHIMGDVNHGNCVVLADGTVKLIDCDSYSIKNDQMRYRCEVGVATHLAPELQGIDLSEVEREKKHDNFGLAVIIFQLLFLGRHPFAGNYLGKEDKSLEDCIRERRFAYGNEDLTNVKQPPGTLSLSQVSSRVAMMFDRAFIMDDRPEPREWIEALEDLSNNLKQCGAHIGHYYFQELATCPWCEIEAKTGLILFPFVSNENGEKGFNVFTVESLLASLDLPRNLPAKPFKPNVLPPPSSEALEIQTSRENQLVIFGLLQFILVAIWTATSGAGSGVSMGVFLMVIFFGISQKLNKDHKERLESELEAARNNWSGFEWEWNNHKDQKTIDDDLTQIRQKITEHQLLQQERREQLEDLKADFLQDQLRIYLSQFSLKQANISGIDNGHLEIYKQLGLRTAADIDAKRFSSLVAIDDKTKINLLEWRRELKKGFEFNPNLELPTVPKNRLEIEFNEKRRKVEKEIEQLLAVLRSGSMTLRHHQKQMVVKAETFGQQLLQAESNFVKVGNNSALVWTLIIITILVPTFGSLFQVSSYNNRTTTKRTYPSPPQYAPNFKVSTEPPQSEIEDYANYQVNENITNKEIEEMSAFEREKSARILHKQALGLIQSKDYKNAEKKLRLAIKFADYFVNVFYTLSDLLYKQKRYSESVKFLEKSLLIDAENENARLLIGENYLQMSKYDQAKEIFLAVVKKNPDSYDANFNLGIIYKEFEDYESARYRFEQATLIRPKDAKSHYEFGLALYKSGYKQSAQEIYEVLFKIDEEKAEKLRRIIDAEPLPPVTVTTKTK